MSHRAFADRYAFAILGGTCFLSGAAFGLLAALSALAPAL